MDGSLQSKEQIRALKAKKAAAAAQEAKDAANQREKEVWHQTIVATLYTSTSTCSSLKCRHAERSWDDLSSWCAKLHISSPLHSIKSTDRGVPGWSTSAAHDSWYTFSGGMFACKGAARAAASSAPPLPKMPPPAPRPAKASKPVPPPPKFSDPVPFRPDSQATIITTNGSTPSFDGTSTGA